MCAVIRARRKWRWPRKCSEVVAASLINQLQRVGPLPKSETKVLFNRPTARCNAPPSAAISQGSTECIVTDIYIEVARLAFFKLNWLLKRIPLFSTASYM